MITIADLWRAAHGESMGHLRGKTRYATFSLGEDLLRRLDAMGDVNKSAFVDLAVRYALDRLEEPVEPLEELIVKLAELRDGVDALRTLADLLEDVATEDSELEKAVANMGRDGVEALDPDAVEL